MNTKTTKSARHTESDAVLCRPRQSETKSACAGTNDCCLTLVRRPSAAFSSPSGRLPRSPSAAVARQPAMLQSSATSWVRSCKQAEGSSVKHCMMQSLPWCVRRGSQRSAAGACGAPCFVNRTICPAVHCVDTSPYLQPIHIDKAEAVQLQPTQGGQRRQHSTSVQLSSARAIQVASSSQEGQLAQAGQGARQLQLTGAPLPQVQLLKRGELSS